MTWRGWAWAIGVSIGLWLVGFWLLSCGPARRPHPWGQGGYSFSADRCEPNDALQVWRQPVTGTPGGAPRGLPADTAGLLRTAAGLRSGRVLEGTMEKRRIYFGCELVSEVALRRLERTVKRVVLLDVCGKVVEGCTLDEWPNVRSVAAIGTHVIRRRGNQMVIRKRKEVSAVKKSKGGKKGGGGKKC